MDEDSPRLPTETAPLEHDQQFLMTFNPYEALNERKPRLAGLILDINGNKTAFLYNRRVYVMPFAFFAKFDAQLGKGVWIAFRFEKKNRLSTIFDVVNPKNPCFPVSYTDEEGLQVETNVVKRDIWEFPHKEINVKMENGQYERRLRYPNRFWSPELDFIPDPNNIFVDRKTEKAMRVQAKLKFDWETFDSNKYGCFYTDVSNLLKVEPVKVLGYSEDQAIVLYSPWQLAAGREYKRISYGPRDPERLFLHRGNEKSRYMGIIVYDQDEQVFVIFNFRLGLLISRCEVIDDENKHPQCKQRPPIGTFVQYCLGQSLTSRTSYEAVKVEVSRELYDVKILIVGEKPHAMMALDIVLPMDFEKSYTVFHPFCGPVKIHHFQLKNSLAAMNSDLTVEDLLGREIRIWVQPFPDSNEAEDPWTTEFWRFTELDKENLFNEDICGM